MSELRFTLLADGSSDRALLPILTWLLQKNGVARPIQSEAVSSMAGRDLTARIRAAIDRYPCDLLFVHRDAEAERRVVRKEEIERSLAAAEVRRELPAVCVVPVRMTEAWLLFNKEAIRGAANNPNGNTPIDLPPLNRLEELPDPKDTLHRILRIASGLRGRRLKKFNPRRQVARLAELIGDFGDFSPLRELEAFQALEDDVKTTVAARGWNEYAFLP